MTAKKATTKKESNDRGKKTSPKEDTKLMGKEVKVVGIGTSAGGLEALKTFFDNVPSSCDLSFVIIQHLSPDYKSLMAELLAKNTQLPIYEVENNMEILPGSVYLIPAKKNMRISSGRLTLEDKSKTGHDLNLPIDIFFRSMAEELGEKAISIVLTGTGSDGTHGVRAIKEVGGMVMVQSPETSKFDGMPRSAISTGLVDYVLPISEMPSELINYVENHKEIGHRIDESNLDTLQEILSHLKKVTNLDFSEYKRPTLVRRISRRMSVNKCNDLKQYLDFLQATPQEAQILYKEFLIGVTKFFRDADAFESLSKHLEKLVSEKNFKQTLKMWSVACSTGEEAYSLAILTKEAMDKANKNLEVKIFATDIDRDSIETASKGVFPESFVPDIGTERLKKYFVKKGDQYVVSQEIRKMIIFSHHNVLTDPPFNRMDLVSCRNLLIYLQPSLQQRLLATFHYSLNLKGILFLGPSESIAEYKSVFKELDRRWKIFENTEISRTLNLDHSTLPDISWQRGIKSATTSVPSRKSIIDNRLSEVLSDTLADEIEAVSVYVDEHFDILHANGNLNKYIALPDRGFTVNLLKMVTDNLSVAISTAVRRATQEKEKIFYRGVRIVTDTSVKIVDVIVRPFKIDKLDTKTYFLVVFLENKASGQFSKNVKDVTDPDEISRVEDLQRELKETKENLQATVEEVETSNEELQATNEELLAANEELQSTNEELQSVNEELHTVNSEHQSKIQELAALNADMDNLLKSTDIGTIFLDKDLKIRWFTPAIKEHFNLLVADVGRPITNFSSNVSGIDIVSEVEYVLKTGKTVERETRLNNDKWFLTRVLPYQDGNYRTQGTVITFVEITQMKSMQEDLRYSEGLFRTLFEFSPNGIVTTNAKGKILRANQNTARMCGIEIDDLKNKEITDLFATSSKKKIETLFKDAAGGNHLSINDRIEIKSNGSKGIPVSVNIEHAEHEQQNLILWSIVDISDQISAQKELKELNENLEVMVDARTKELRDKDILLQSVLEATTAGYWTWEPKTGYQIYSDTFSEVIKSHDKNDPTEDQWKKILGEENYSILESKLQEHVKSKGKKPLEVICELTTDGSPMWVFFKGKAIEWNGKDATKIVGSLVNITDLKKIESQLANSNSKLEESLQRLSLKNHELEQIAYVATHDLRAPVVNLANLAKMLKIESLEDRNKEVCERIVSSINSLDNTLEELLNIAALNKEGVPKKFKQINFEKSIDSVLMELEETFASDFKVEKDLKVKTIKYFPAHIHSILSNLLSNAIKYRSEQRPLEIKIATYSEKNYTVLEITDNGIGIDLERQGKKLFGMFKQLHPGYKGKGLGLYIVKNQVEIMGGEIEVKSKPEEGSTFKISLLDQAKVNSLNS
ncbi:chemotaxis protein CheB [Luteibaculum oceani]|uniref:PAS domain-containing protein n=1 Tax=Luteibaculum oceani TaxID=1294296 RepID=A0A5C6VJC7_9FLAO|nr:chemotaxis protein CheB [Luteibaculum oceani]TXC85377.1 PAS domain-containing protein [Luteibaculum oceani]